MQRSLVGNAMNGDQGKGQYYKGRMEAPQQERGAESIKMYDEFGKKTAYRNNTNDIRFGKHFPAIRFLLKHVCVEGLLIRGGSGREKM